MAKIMLRSDPRERSARAGGCVMGPTEAEKTAIKRAKREGVRILAYEDCRTREWIVQRFTDQTHRDFVNAGTGRAIVAESDGSIRQHRW